MRSERSPHEPKPGVTREDLARYADEDLMREVQDEARLRDEAPPHHR
ncbi:hypothetical protein [Mycobacterium vicinigordonae]|uniref:Uncharacterized protein n=1 Tax=Mycobacterium vicinigordonae TaxID=1719132 RepID=A0A7D6ILV4_9MYCO|nr:hypothetical protein [Mycobacterium vicinigordonae]QLL07300.1 hypothetical protein H0P51_27220 [Mycobacterium vicinigordonae]